MARSLDAAVYDVLSGSATLDSKVNGRIYPSYGDPGDDFPLVVFEQTGSTINPLFGHKLM